MQIKIKKLYDNAKLPERGSEQAAGYDLYCHHVEDDNIIFEAKGLNDRSAFELDDETGLYVLSGINVYPGETIKVHTGLAMQIPAGYFGALYARSGYATKQGMRPANCVGVVDSDYRGEIIVAIHNDGNKPVVIKTGERVAQIVIQPYLPVTFDVAEELDDTVRGEGGFGSTGKA